MINVEYSELELRYCRSELAAHEFLTSKKCLQTRLKMLLIPTLPVKLDITAMLRLRSNAGNAENAEHCCG